MDIVNETGQPTREEVLEVLRELRSGFEVAMSDYDIKDAKTLDLAIAYLEAQDSASKRKAILAADTHARLWREVCALVKPHQRKGERVLHALRRMLI